MSATAKRSNEPSWQAGVHCFCVNPSKGLTGTERAELLASALPRILQIVKRNPRGGYIKGINKRGQIRHLFPRVESD